LSAAIRNAPQPTAAALTFLLAKFHPEEHMAVPVSHNHNLVFGLAAAVIALLALLLVFGGGDTGRRSGGENNPVQTDQGR
jgi:hypothetical protein